MLTGSLSTALKKKTFSFGIRPQIRIYPILRYKAITYTYQYLLYVRV